MTVVASSDNKISLAGLKFDRSNWQWLLAWAIVSVFLIAYHLRAIPYIFDDAYIHFRIAQNFAGHGVPYFNLGEPVMASSSSAWTLFLALLIKLLPSSVNISGMIAIANALFTSVGMIVYTALARQLAPIKLTYIWYVPLAIIYLSVTVRASAGQMEVALALLILGLAIRLYAAKSPAAFLLLAVAVFFRLEFIVFFLAFSAYSVFTRQLTIKSIGYALLVAHSVRK